MDCSDEPLSTKGYSVFKIILLVYLLGHLFAQADIAVNHDRHAIISHDVSSPSLME
jgi:hypothetical protein